MYIHTYVRRKRPPRGIIRLVLFYILTVIQFCFCLPIDICLLRIRQEMRKRELQSIPLKLAELKEYDAVKAERAFNKCKNAPAYENNSKEPSPIANVGPKSKEEIHKRLNTTM